METHDQSLSFGPFDFIPAQRLLMRDGTALRLGSRAFDVLNTLVERAGDVVSKEDIIAAVWPNTYVDEANLRVHISSLRKALGEDQLPAPLIENVPGRGYAFVAPISRPERRLREDIIGIDVRQSNLPLSVVRPLGRESFIEGLVEQLRQRRLLSIVGPGGMGKTTVAVAAAEMVSSDYPDGIAFVDLGTMNRPDLIVPGLLSAVEQASGANGSVRDLWSFLRGRSMLLVLDNCEHLIAPVADLAEQLLRHCPSLHLLATSREPLRVSGEWVQRLPPLDFPLEEGAPTAAEVMTYPAVQLFVERASEALGGFSLTEVDAPIAADICRRLDGIALAIELAAGRIDTIGLQGLANSLDDRFRLLKQGRRTALPRHQTLRATLDWSYGLLSAPEQKVLRQLAGFKGGFTLEAARHVVEGAGDELDDILAGLASKSLLTADTTTSMVHYRLLETTRTYCSEKLVSAGEAAELAKRHALFYQTLFERAAREWGTRPTADWVEVYGRELGNLRAALDWAFGPDGPVQLGIALTVSAVPLWFQLSLLEERLAAAKRAVALLGNSSETEKRQRMQLNVVLGWPQMNAIAGVESGSSAWRTVLSIAEELGENDYQLRALWALWVDSTNIGDNRGALALAERFILASAASSDPNDQLIGKRIRGRSRHLLGDQSGARSDITEMLQSYRPGPNSSHLVRFQYDQRVMAQSALARILMVQGFPEQALSTIARMVDEALVINDAPTLCHVLFDGACTVSLLTGDDMLARHYIELLTSRTGRTSMDVWHIGGLACSGIAMLRSGRLEDGLDTLEGAINKLQSSGYQLQFAMLRSALADGLARSGRIDEAVTAIDLCFAECGDGGELWFLPELHRIKGDILQRAGHPAGAEHHLLLARQIAREQRALMWELRSTLSLARLWTEAGRHGEARSTLGALLPRIPEGFMRPDFVAASLLLESLAQRRD